MDERRTSPLRRTVRPGAPGQVTQSRASSAAKRVGLETGFKITSVVLPNPDRPSVAWVYMPALALVGAVWVIQARRRRPARSLRLDDARGTIPRGRP